MENIIKKSLVCSIIAVCLYCMVICAEGLEFVGTLGWRCVDKNGDFLTNVIVENEEGMRFYATDSGELLREHILEDFNDNTYYFNYFGAMARNCWVAVDPDTVENKTDYVPEVYYYYFNNEGKAIKSIDGKPRFFRIDGKAYLFNEYGQMLSGYIAEDGRVLDALDMDNPLEETMYCTDETGALKIGWVPYENVYSDIKYLEYIQTLWYFFDPKTFKRRGKGLYDERKINGKFYAFDEKGFMYTGFGAYESGATSNVEYRGEENDGQKYKKRWAYALPPDDGTYDDEEMEKKNWFYFDGAGRPVKDTMKKINKNYYSFNKKGIMQTGIIAYLDGTILFITDMEETSGEDIIKKGKYTYRKNGEIHYFFNTIFRDPSNKNMYYSTAEDFYDAESDMFISRYVSTDMATNILRDFNFTDRKADICGNDETSFDYGLHNKRIKFYYFGDAGERINGIRNVHMMDDEYVYGAGSSGPYDGYKNNKFYYNGFQLRADKDIKYGIYCIETSLPQTKQKFPYKYLFVPKSYSTVTAIMGGVVMDMDFAMFNSELADHYFVKLPDNECIYKVLDNNGKLVKGRNRAFKDPYGRYWYIEKNGNWLYGIFNTDVKKGTSQVINLSTIDRISCPAVLLNGTKKEKIDFFKEVADDPDPVTGDFVFKAQDLFKDDFKDYYTFIKSGKITDVIVKKNKEDETKVDVGIKYNGMMFKSSRNDKLGFVPFGMYDDGNLTATFFTENNDFNEVPDNNEFFINCCWDDVEAIDLCDCDGDGIFDFYDY